MAVRIIDNHWYVDVRHLGVRRRLRSPEDSKRGAQAYESVIRHRLACGYSLYNFGQHWGQDVPPDTPHEPAKREESPEDEPTTLSKTFRVFSEEWMNTYVATNNKPSEQKKKRHVLNKHLLPAFGALALPDITNLTIEHYKAQKLVDKLSAKTINNQLSILRKALTCARSWGFLETVPEFIWLKAQRPAIEYLSDDEVAALQAYGDEPLWSTMILLGLRAGLRIGELLGLHWEDVDLQANTLTVQRNLSEYDLVTPKNNRIRVIPLSADVGLALSAWKKRSSPRRKAGFVFLNDEGTPLNCYRADYALKRICRHVGIKEYSWHKLRHTFATHLLARGGDIRYVQELLGHSTLAMTERYTHVMGSKLRSTVELLSNNPQNSGQPVGSGISTISKDTSTVSTMSPISVPC